MECSFRNEMEFPACKLAHILFNFVSLRASVRGGELEDPVSILQMLCLIEGDLSDWLECLPAHWTFTTERTAGKSANIFGGQHHTYQNIWISRIWSHFRWTRLMVHEGIQNKFSQLPNTGASDSLSLQTQSLTILRQMATDICVSVPYHLCVHATQPDNSVPRPEIMGSFDLLWPLTVVASSKYVSEEMRTWVMQLVEGIGHTMGVKHAFELAALAKVRLHRAPRIVIESYK